MAIRARSVAVSVVSALFIFACSGGGGSTTGGGGSSGGGSIATLDGFLAQYCDVFQPCCAKVSRTYDQGKCRALFTALVGDSQYDSGKAQQCLDAARGAATSPTFCEGGGSTNGACEGVLVSQSKGTKQPGELCENSDECADGPGEDRATCASTFSNNATTRACQHRGHGREGEDLCVGERDENGTSITTSTSDGQIPKRVVLCWVSDGLYCDDTTKKCTKQIPIGADCKGFNNFQCGKDGRCDAGKCVAKLGAGGACTSTSDCLDKHRCDPTEKKCVALLPNGTACKTNDECENSRCENGKCGGVGSNLTLNLVCSQ